MDSYYEPPDDPYADMTEEEYDAMIEAAENAESMYIDMKIDELRGN